MLFGKSTAPANGQTSSSGRGGFDTTYASISSTGGSLATTETALRRARLGTEEEEFMTVARGREDAEDWAHELEVEHIYQWKRIRIK